MTILSVNLNKLALLRNSRGHNYPNLLDYAERYIELGVKGITIHPRPDERHIKRQDARDLAELLNNYPDVELNIEGYPSDEFLLLVEKCKPAQCTLVPDADNQLTSDHGWDFSQKLEMLKPIIQDLHKHNIRSAVFIDPDIKQIEIAATSGANRIELYTEEFAKLHDSSEADNILDKYRRAAMTAHDLGLGINAGHDLNLTNLARFLTIPNILEVSIGHALTIECIDQGLEKVINQYLAICEKR